MRWEASQRIDGAPDRGMVARWETGRRIPTPYWRVHLATVLQLPAAQLDKAASIARARRSDGSESAESPFSDDRLSHVLQYPGSVDLASVGYLRERLRRLDEQYDRAPSTALIRGRAVPRPDHFPWHARQAQLCAARTARCRG